MCSSMSDNREMPMLLFTNLVVLSLPIVATTILPSRGTDGVHDSSIYNCSDDDQCIAKLMSLSTSIADR